MNEIGDRFMTYQSSFFVCEVLHLLSFTCIYIHLCHAHNSIIKLQLLNHGYSHMEIFKQSTLCIGMDEPVSNGHSRTQHITR